MWFQGQQHDSENHSIWSVDILTCPCPFSTWPQDFTPVILNISIQILKCVLWCKHAFWNILWNDWIFVLFMFYIMMTNVWFFSPYVKIQNISWLILFSSHLKIPSIHHSSFLLFFTPILIHASIHPPLHPFIFQVSIKILISPWGS